MFEKYQKIKRWGSPEVEGINKGLCYVFPKLDGANGSVWWDWGIHAGSRNRELTLDEDNHGFYNYVLDNKPIKKLLRAHTQWRLFGEWLVPHNLRTYQFGTWNRFYVFDVVVGETYLMYEQYAPVLEEFGVPYVPFMQVGHNLEESDFTQLMGSNTYLMKKGHTGEGIVIKNYDFVNKYGRTTWAKMVRSEFKQKKPKPEVKEGLEHDIAARFVTKALVDKEKAKINTEPVQPRLLSTVFHCILVEEMDTIVKKYKEPTINFKELRKQTYAKVKEHAPELF